MLRQICDACREPFDVDPAELPDDRRVACPYCGDVNRIDAATAAAPVTHTPAAAKTSIADERDLLVVRPALARGHPFIVLAQLGVALASSLGLAWVLLGSPPAWTSPWFGPLLALLIVLDVAWFFWFFVFSHRWDRLRVTTYRSIDETGIVMRSTSEVLHKHIRNIRIDQSLWQRIVSIGDIRIDSAAGGDDGAMDIRISNIPDPYGLKAVIDEHRRPS